MASPTRAKTWTNSRSISARTGGWVGSTGVSGRRGPAAAATPSDRSPGRLRRARRAASRAAGPMRKAIAPTVPGRATSPGGVGPATGPAQAATVPWTGHSPPVRCPGGDLETGRTPAACRRDQRPSSRRRAGARMTGLGLLVGLVLGVLGSASRIGLGLRARHGRRAVTVRRPGSPRTRLADAQGVARQPGDGPVRAGGGTLARMQAGNARSARSSSRHRAARPNGPPAWEEDRERLVGTVRPAVVRGAAKNTEQFLTLADARLKEAQEAARGDLGQRQQAISQLLQPLKRPSAATSRGCASSSSSARAPTAG